MNDCSATFSRRRFLSENAMGVGGVALAWLQQQEGLLAKQENLTKARPKLDLLPKQPHHKPQAKAMISLFMHGGPSHMDLMDPKPELSRFHGKTYQEDVGYSFFNDASKTLFGSRYSFRHHGQC